MPGAVCKDLAGCYIADREARAGLQHGDEISVTDLFGGVGIPRVQANVDVRSKVLGVVPTIDPNMNRRSHESKDPIGLSYARPGTRGMQRRSPHTGGPTWDPADLPGPP
jgi:hypothetical protein